MAQTITLANDAIVVLIDISPTGAASITSVLPPNHPPRLASSFYPQSPLPLVELRLSGEANRWEKSGKSMVGSYIGARLVYRSHRQKDTTSADGTPATALDIVLEDDTSGVEVTSHLTIFQGLPFVRSCVTVKNTGKDRIVLNSVPSIIIGGLTTTKDGHRDYEVCYANNTWFRETQWTTHSLPSLGLDTMGLYPVLDGAHASLASFSLSNRSSFSTQGHLPMGILRLKRQTETWIWQIESSGSWKWELGDWKDSIYLGASGPMADAHEFRQALQPGEEFTSVPVAVGHVFDHSDTAFAQITEYRRRIRRPHKDHQKLPVIFNDYMNCLMGDPTEAKIQALIGPVANSGAEYFVIDAGWYADDSNWWYDVGAWQPSQKRFPSGFKTLLDKIRNAGMTPGLWMEPEVMGINNPLAKTLPREAFFERDGQRITEKGRHQLDFRCPAVVDHLDRIVNTYIEDYHVGYFKFDYNIEITQGTDLNNAPSTSPGAAQLAHSRAYLAWISSLLDRHPSLIIENCSSGAQRMDYAMLVTHTLQSTSDQETPELYSAISATVHTAVTPEQGATWAYPQGEWSDDINALTVVNALLGRIHLSGRLDTMTPHQLEIVYSGMRAYKSIRGDIPTSLPFWPLGLAGWHDDWLCLGLRARDDKGADTGKYYLAVWRRGGRVGVDLPMNFEKFEGKTKKDEVKVERLYPTTIAEPMDGWWESGRVVVEASRKICAALFLVEV